MIIMGAGICQWFHGDATYRAVLALLMLTGSMGRNGGGWAHYVGQEKCRPVTGWATMAMATDWQRPPRQMIGTAYWYTHTDQWRYDGYRADALTSPLARGHLAGLHTIDTIALSARLGWMPSYPQFDRNPLDLADEIAAEAGARRTSPPAWPAGLQDGTLRFAIEDPDAPQNWPRCLTLWRANLLGSSAKGDEYFLRHLLGTHDSLRAEQTPARPRPRDVAWRDEEPPRGKLDLLLSLDFRMTSSTLLSDVVLPAATWYEKHDLNTTDMHPFVHAFNPGDRPALRVPHRLRRLPRHRPPVQRARPRPTSGCAATSSPCRCSTTRRARPRSPAAGCWTGERARSRPSRAGRCRTSWSSSATTRPSPTRWPRIGPLVDRLGHDDQGRHLPPRRGDRATCRRRTG